MTTIPYSSFFTAFSIIGFILCVVATAFGNIELKIGFAATLMFTIMIVASLMSAMPEAEELR